MNVREYFKMLSLMHKALIGGQITLAIVSVFFILTNSFIPSYTESRNMFLIISVFIITVCVLLSNFVYKKLLNVIINLNSLKQKFTKFKIVYILRLVFLETPSTVAIVFYILSGKIELLIFTVAIVLISFNLKPNKESIIIELKLSEEEKKELENEDIIISN